MFHFGWGICFFGGVENAGAGYARPLQSFWQSLSFCTVFFDNFARICCFWHLCYIIIVNVWENVLFRAFSPVLCIGKGTMSEKEKILIADDSAMNRAILTEMLGDGYEILEAENGRQAVSIMQTNVDIDLLLLDIMMPEMDGFDVLAMMNKYHWIDDIPVIMISAVALQKN